MIQEGHDDGTTTGLQSASSISLDIWIGSDIVYSGLLPSRNIFVEILHERNNKS